MCFVYVDEPVILLNSKCQQIMAIDKLVTLYSKLD